MIKELDGIERAFPQVFEYTLDDGTKATTIRYGMELRDYFAAKALEVSIQQTRDYYGVDRGYVAKWCYDMADAMLEARK